MVAMGINEKANDLVKNYISGKNLVYVIPEAHCSTKEGGQARTFLKDGSHSERGGI